MTDPDELTTTQTWDVRQRLLSRTNAADETTTYVGRPGGQTWTPTKRER
jgi:YD repeat-containing protein